MSQSEARTANERKSGRFRLIVPCEIKGSKGSNMVPLRDISLDGCRVINPDLPAGDLAAAAHDPAVRDAFRERLASFMAGATGFGIGSASGRKMLRPDPEY